MTEKELLEQARLRAAQAHRPARVGLLGGTFDPIHNGHVACAALARDVLDLDAVLFLVANIPSFKRDKELTDAADRLAMVQLAIRGEARCAASEREIARGGISYTVDTLRELHCEFGEDAQLFFVLGQDSYESLPHWHGAREIARLATIACIPRASVAEQHIAPEALAQQDPPQEGAPLFHVVMLPSGVVPTISSTQVRACAAAGEDISKLVGDDVARYIEFRGLYGASRCRKA